MIAHAARLALFLCVPLDCFSAGWPQLLGPSRDGVSTESVSAPWPKNGPPIVWQRKTGAGFAGPVVARGRLVLFHRLGDREVIEALDARTGEPQWKFDYPTAYQDDFGFDPGPRATPSIADGKVFTHGADGALHALDFATGKKLWSVDCKNDFAAPKGFFGRACSPLVEGRAILLNVGGRGGAGVVAFDKDDGAVLWKAMDDEPSYSSPVAATVAGKRVVFVLTRGQFAGLDPADGKVAFTVPFRPPVQASVTGATPTVVGSQVFISAVYDLGAVLFQFTAGTPQKTWSGDGQLSLQYSTAVPRDGFLYGLHGRHDFPAGTELRCVELNTGTVRWSQPGLHGANVLLAGDQLLVLTEKGELIRAAAAPGNFRETSRAQILGSGVRAHPALAEGLFYARDKSRLVCIKLN